MDKGSLSTIPEFTYLIVGEAAKQMVREGEVLVASFNYSPEANFSHWNKYSKGIEQVIINGQIVIENGKYMNVYAGKFVQ